MATAIFDGLDSDFDADANWSGGGGTSGKPTASDDVLIRSAVVDVTSNCAAFTAVAVGTVTISPGIKVKFGMSGTAITFSNVTSLVAAPGADFRFASSGTVTAAVVEPTGGTFYFNSGTFTTARVTTGSYEIESSAIVTTLEASGAKGIARLNATGFTTLRVIAGELVSYRNLGTCTFHNSKVYGKDTATMTSGFVGPGALYAHDSSGTITLIEVYRLGTFTGAMSRYSFTITNHTVWRGAFVATTSPGVTITLSNASTYRGSFLGNGVI